MWKLLSPIYFTICMIVQDGEIKAPFLEIVVWRRHQRGVELWRADAEGFMQGAIFHCCFLLFFVCFFWFVTFGPLTFMRIQKHRFCTRTKVRRELASFDKTPNLHSCLPQGLSISTSCCLLIMNQADLRVPPCVSPTYVQSSRNTCFREFLSISLLVSRDIGWRSLLTLEVLKVNWIFFLAIHM